MAAKGPTPGGQKSLLNYTIRFLNLAVIRTGATGLTLELSCSGYFEVKTVSLCGLILVRSDG
jgi:hypothetical protein